MSKEYSEDTLIEQATENTLQDLGWEVITAWKKGGSNAEQVLGREHRGEVILRKHLGAALKKLNPDLPTDAYEQAIDQIAQRAADKTLGRINKEKYELLRNGVPVQYTDAEGKLRKEKLRVFDFKQYQNNHFLAVRQLWLRGEHAQRRPDVLGFVNGIPLLFIELKAHGVDLRQAYDGNLKDYKDSIPHLFYTNAFIILSNGTDARVGTVTSPYKFFLEWKRIEEEEEGLVSLDTMLRGTCAPHRFMDIFENFLLFDDSGGEVVKLMAKNHQYLGVNKVLEKVANKSDLERKLGVFWHTQGSGKSYSMVFLCEKIHRKLGGAYTFLIVADRTELENQLYDTFSGVGVVNDKEVMAGRKKGLTGRAHLRELLADNHRYVFTLIHKFSIDPKEESQYPLITERENIIVISDEAHRTQAGTYAQNMRFYALPNASFLGFTGTPIIKEEEELTKNIFGEYVSIYDFKRAIEDEATLPLRYVNRGERLAIDNPDLDEEMAEILEDENLDDDQRKKLEYQFNRDYPILTAEARLDAIAKDLVWHFNERGYQGKAMFVALDKPTAVRMHQLIKSHWPAYLQELEQRIETTRDAQQAQELQRKYQRVAETEICVVVSSEQNEVERFEKMDLDIRPHRKKMLDRNLEKEFKNPDHPFRLAIVCAMWITGFDAQCVSTVYLDKPIKGHTLMQTIARANRVYDDEKENGLIVDYGNVYKQLEKAYSIYGEGSKGKGKESGKGQRPVEELKELAEELEVAISDTERYLQDLGFDTERLFNVKPMQKIALVGEGADAVSLNEQTRTKFEIRARNVFRKYKALFPEEEAEPFTQRLNAIEAIYKQLNQQVRTADVTEIMWDLQKKVSDSISIDTSVEEEAIPIIEIGDLDFEQLQKAFERSPRKNTTVFNIQQAVERKLQQMLRENPLRLEFYERYQEIIEAYNRGKSLEDTEHAFTNLRALIQDMGEEEQRHIKEGLDKETLAIFDILLKNKDLDAKERKAVKKVAQATLEKLKAEKLKVARWRESRQLRAQVKITIRDALLYLPAEQYPEKDVEDRKEEVFHHIFASYKGAGQTVYKG